MPDNFPLRWFDFFLKHDTSLVMYNSVNSRQRDFKILIDSSVDSTIRERIGEQNTFIYVTQKLLEIE